MQKVFFSPFAIYFVFSGRCCLCSFFECPMRDQPAPWNARLAPPGRAGSSRACATARGGKEGALRSLGLGRGLEHGGSGGGAGSKLQPQGNGLDDGARNGAAKARAILVRRAASRDGGGDGGGALRGKEREGVRSRV